MTSANLLGLSGSLRQGATNRKLLREAARLFGECTYTEADLKLPLYDGDDEDATGIPASVTALADQIAAADGILISTPEYNSGPSGVIKNALDWVSRVHENPWQGKPVAVMSAAAGRTGGMCAGITLRTFLMPFQPRVVPGPPVMLAASFEGFDENGHLISEVYTKNLQTLMNNLATDMGR